MRRLLGRGPRTVALTFDDGPSDWTSSILDTLRDHAALATFFVIGDLIPGREPILRRTSEEGHELGNHSLSHRRLDVLDRDEIRHELHETNERIAAVVGSPPRLFRPPYLGSNAMVQEVAAELGLRSPSIRPVFTDDWAERSSGVIAHSLLSKTRDGTILLLHDGMPRAVEAADRQPTVAACEVIVSTLASRGFRFVTLSELLAARSPRSLL